MCLSGASNGHCFLRVAILARSGTASEKAALLQNKPSLPQMNTQGKNDKKGRIKNDNFVLYNSLAELWLWLLCGAQQHVFQGLFWKGECTNSREQKTNRQFVTH